jgi:WD40 repeat protein
MGMFRKLSEHLSRTRTLLLLAALPIACCGACTSGAIDVAAKVAVLPEPDKNAIVRGMDFSPDGNRIAVDAENHTVNIWDWRNRRIERTLQKPELGSDSGVVNPLLFSPDGRLLANCQQFSRETAAVRIWDATTGTTVKDIPPNLGTSDPGTCTGVAFTSDGKLFMRTADTGRKPGNNLIAFGTDNLELIWGLPIDPYFVPNSLASSPDGGTVALSGTLLEWYAGVFFQKRRIYLINIRQREVAQVISTLAMGPIAWSPDGRRIGIAGELMAEIFDVQTGQKLVQERLEDSAKMHVQFSPDGRFFIECDMNSRGTGLGVKIWDGQHKTLLQEIPGNIGSIAVSRDGRYLAVGETGGTSIWQFK